MKILIDVDGVLADQVPPVLERFNADYGYEYKKEDIQKWDEEIGHTDIKTEIESALLKEDFIMKMKPILGAVQAINYLSRRNEIIIATNRDPSTDEYTKKWLEEQNIPFHAFVNTNERGKGKLVGDVLVDDYDGNVRAFAESGKTAILFSQPWNSNNPEIEEVIKQDNVYRGIDWSDVIRIIEEFEEMGVNED